MPIQARITEQLGTAMLQGRPLGRKHYPRLCEVLADVPSGDVALLDFAGVEIVTGSWVNEALVPLLRWAADDRNDIFPVFLNFDTAWLDELQMVAEWTHSCFLVSRGKTLPKSASLVGNLDVGQKATLIAVVKGSKVTGAALDGQEGVKGTAWNNRLKDLYQKRLIRREKRGREQVYSPVVGEINFNG
ncbi:MAG TPA: hypothetical protein VGM05_18535 [Planctomycetaceae bacterium]|jgi:hypothetical protein